MPNLFVPQRDSVKTYATLQDLFDGYGATEATLKINKEMTLTQATICPSTVSIEMVGAGKITTNGFNYTQNGPFEAPLKQVFDVSGGGSIIGLKVIYGEWHGMSTNETGANNTTYFNNCITSIVSNGEIFSPSGTLTAPS